MVYRAHASIAAHPSNPLRRQRRSLIPPSATTGSPSPRPIRLACATPSAAAPGCDRVGKTGDTNSTAAPARAPANASERSCAGHVVAPATRPCTGQESGGSAATSTSPRARAIRRTRRNSARRSADGVAWWRNTTPLPGGIRTSARQSATPIRSSVISQRSGYRSATRAPIARR